MADHGVGRRSFEFFDRSIYHGPTNTRTIALTFDDGPGPQTQELLRYLEREDIVATFFQCGMHVERCPAITRQMHADGHEIGNHGFSHRRLIPQFRGGLSWPSPLFIYREIATTQRVIAAACGTAPKLFRAPYGLNSLTVEMIRRRMELTGVHWSVIGHDWEWPARRIASHVLTRCTPGAIICLHDGRDVKPSADISEMMAALKIIVRSLRADGYTFNTVSGMLAQSALPVAALAT